GITSRVTTASRVRDPRLEVTETATTRGAARQPGPRRKATPSALVGDQVGVALQVHRPAVAGSDAVALAFPARAVTVEVAMVELDPRAFRRLGNETHLDLTRLLQVRFDLPLRADVPAEHDAVRGLEREHAGPLALAAVNPAVEDPAAGPWLEDRFRDVDRQH